MSEQTSKKPAFFRLLAGNMKIGEGARNIWCVRPDVPTTLDSFLYSEAYAHVLGKQVRAGDHLEITAHDGSWYAHLLVRSVEGPDVSIGVLSHVEFAPAAMWSANDYVVEWGGQLARARVVRLTDRHVMVDSLPSKAAAEDWLRARCVPVAQEPAQQAA